MQKWQLAILRWRALPTIEKQRIRWQRIPRNVAQSMAFEGETVSLQVLQSEHDQRVPPPAMSRPDSGS